MAFQLIIRNARETTLAEFFSRGMVLRVEHLPFRLGGKGVPCVDAVAAQLGKGLLEFSAGKDGTVGVTVTDGQGASCPPRPMRHGDSLEVGEAKMHFFLLRDRPKTAWSAAALGLLALVGVVAGLAIEVSAFAAVPFLMHHSSHWRREGELQAINYQTDALRNELRKIVPADTVAAAFQQALLAELDDRARFLRHSGNAMHTTARREMLENLHATEELVSRFKDNPRMDASAATELQVDTPVRRIIDAK